MSGASPDGLVGNEGLIEIKCPTTATHLETLSSREVPAKHLPQIYWRWPAPDETGATLSHSIRACRSRCGWLSAGSPRDHAAITALEAEVTAFLQGAGSKDGSAHQPAAQCRLMGLQLTVKERRLAKAYRSMRRRVRQRSPQTPRDSTTQLRPGVSTKTHKAAIAQLFCLATALRYGLEKGGVQVAHLRFSSAAHGKFNPGLQRKPHDRWTLPPSPAEHRRQHAGSEIDYWEELGVDPHKIAKALWEESPKCRSDAGGAARSRSWYGQPAERRHRDELGGPCFCSAGPLYRASRSGRVAQRESTSLTSRGSQVQSLSRPPLNPL